MDGVLCDGVVTVGGNARQQFHDARGYGTPVDGDEIRLARVEAAHLLLRGDLDAVVDDGDRLDFPAFFTAAAAADERFPLLFLVYA
ncbi:MAG: tRNA-intron lyase, partial [Halonotius sp.]